MNTPAIEGTAAERLRRTIETRARAEIDEAVAIAEFAAENEWPVDAEIEVIGQRPARIGADGTPVLDEFVALEVAALMGVSVGAATWLIRDIVNLRFRHPRVWARMRAGAIPVFRARQLAVEMARFDLTPEQLDRLEDELVGNLGRLPWRRLLNLCHGLIADLVPEQLAERARKARAERYVRRLPTDDPSVGYLSARVETADALFFDAMVDRIADILGAQGDVDAKDVRRAKSVGILATPARATLLLAEAAVQIEKANAGSGDAGSGDAGSGDAGSGDAGSGHAGSGHGGTGPSNPDPSSAPSARGQGVAATRFDAAGCERSRAFHEPSLFETGPEMADSTATAPEAAIGATGRSAAGIGSGTQSPPGGGSSIGVNGSAGPVPVDDGSSILPDWAGSPAPPEGGSSIVPNRSAGPAPVDDGSSILPDWAGSPAPPEGGSSIVPNRSTGPAPGDEGSSIAANESVESVWLAARAALPTIRWTDPRLQPKSTLYVHLAEDTLMSGRGPVRVENVGPVAASMLGFLVGGTRITLTPVIRPYDTVAVDAYEIPRRIREQVILRDLVEVFPFSSRSARNQQLDHTRPYRPGLPAQTAAANLGPLSTKVHRAKTHGHWNLAQPSPGVFWWRSPNDNRYRITRAGVTRLRADTPFGKAFRDALWRYDHRVSDDDDGQAKND